MSKKKLLVITTGGVGIVGGYILLNLKPKNKINLGRIKEIEKELECEFLFVSKEASRTKYRAENETGGYELQKEMLDSVEKQYEDKNKLKRSCQKGKNNKLRFSRNKDGFWVAMIPSTKKE